jgi:Zn-dependent oligopeptidase
VTEPLAFYQNVSPSKELRDSSNEAESLVRDFGVECSMRLDVFSSKVAAEKNIKESGQWDKLSPEEQRLVEKMVWILTTFSRSDDIEKSIPTDFRWHPRWSCSPRGKEK